MPDILWWFLIGLLQILSLMLIPAIPVVIWVLWEWYRQETEGLIVADWRDRAACCGSIPHLGPIHTTRIQMGVAMAPPHPSS